MSPRGPVQPPVPAAAALRDRVSVAIGGAVQQERQRRGWSLSELASRARISAGTASGVEAGRTTSLETCARLAVALGLDLDVSLRSRHRRAERPSADFVHAAMGELEAGWLQARGFHVAIDHPYQHYQFAGRADLLAWRLDPPAMLHIENRTRFPDLQAAAGSFNAKRRYLAGTLAVHVGVRGFLSETHVMAGLWSAEVIHAVRLRRASFRALCPDSDDRLRAWLHGEPPARGNSSSFVLLDPLASGRQAKIVDLERVFTGTRPRLRGYAEAAKKLQRVGR